MISIYVLIVSVIISLVVGVIFGHKAGYWFGRTLELYESAKRNGKLPTDACAKCGNPSMLYIIWAEGWVATGGSGGATIMGKEEANTFQEACDLLATHDKSFAKYYDRESLTYWGCKLFDNEVDARRFAG